MINKLHLHARLVHFGVFFLTFLFHFNRFSVAIIDLFSFHPQPKLCFYFSPKLNLAEILFSLPKKSQTAESQVSPHLSQRQGVGGPLKAI